MFQVLGTRHLLVEAREQRMLDLWSNWDVPTSGEKRESGQPGRVVGGEHPGKSVSERVTNNMCTFDFPAVHLVTNPVGKVVQRWLAVP